MGAKLSQWIRERTTGKIALATLIIFGVFIALVLPWQAGLAEAYSNGAGSPDSAFWYAPEDLYAQAEAYGPEGRAAYVRARWTFDVAWPLVYTAFLATAISWVWGRLASAASPWQRLNLVPVIGMGLDFLENSAASVVIGRYPARTPVIDSLAPVLTFAKWIFVNGSFVVLLAGLAMLGWRWLRQRTRSTA